MAAVSVTAALLFFSAGCRRHAADDIFQDYTQSPPRTWDPARASDIHSGRILSKVHRGLFRISADNTAVAELAKGYKVSQNRLEIVLQPARFNDGSELQAYDVALCLARLSSKDELTRLLADYTRSTSRQTLPRSQLAALLKAVPPSPLNFLFRGIKRIRVTGSDRLQVEFTKIPGAFQYLLTLPAAYIYSWRHIVSRFAAGESIFKTPDDFLYTGLYVPEKTSGNRSLSGSLLLRRNRVSQPFDQTAENLPAGYRFHFISEESSARFLFIRGDLDVFYPPPFLRGDLDRRFQALRREILAVYYIAVNTKQKDLDLNFRQALNHSVDKLLIIDRLLRGAARPLNGPVPYSLLPEKVAVEAAYPFDEERARELLAASAYKGRMLRLYVKQDSQQITQARSIAAMAARVGIQIEVYPTEKRILMEKNHLGHGDLYYFNWYADYPEAENFLLPLFHSGNIGYGGNRAAYNDQPTDRLLEQLQLLQPGPNRNELVMRLHRQMKTEAPWVYLWTLEETVLTGRHVKDYRLYSIYSGDRGDGIALGKSRSGSPGGADGTP